MPGDFSQQLWTAFRGWWREHSQAQGAWGASSLLARELWEFAYDSTPERRRSRYGDMDYDWEHRVNTTAGTVGWRVRLLGLFHSAYQPTEPSAFHEMMGALPIDFREFTFIDIGSGKGRTLLMASEYPFLKIVGVELIAELHREAEANIAAFRATRPPAATATTIESVCLDAQEFVFPETPLVVYLFNPLPQTALLRVMRNLEASWRNSPRPVWIIYHNPILEATFAESQFLERVIVKPHCSIYRAAWAAVGL